MRVILKAPKKTLHIFPNCSGSYLMPRSQYNVLMRNEGKARVALASHIRWLKTVPQCSCYRPFVWKWDDSLNFNAVPSSDCESTRQERRRGISDNPTHLMPFPTRSNQKKLVATSSSKLSLHTLVSWSFSWISYRMRFASNPSTNPKQAFSTS